MKTNYCHTNLDAKAIFPIHITPEEGLRYANNPKMEVIRKGDMSGINDEIRLIRYMDNKTKKAYVVNLTSLTIYRTGSSYVIANRYNRNGANK